MAEREPWTGDVVRDLHMHGLTQKDLAEEAGCTRTWMSMVLNGKYRSATSKQRVLDALARLTASAG